TYPFLSVMFNSQPGLEAYSSSSNSSTSLLAISSSNSSFEPTMIPSNSLIPVPAGIRLPVITFSFRPVRSSDLPLIDACDSTLVVYWNEAAEIQLLVRNDAFVIPNHGGADVAGSASLN